MSESALSEGSLIAERYRLEHHLGEGGMGTVWAATHTVTRRSVAMKFLKDSLRSRAELKERFLREAAAASALKHPNVVEIIDVFDFAEGCPVMVMELLRGETLGQKLLREERLAMEETAAILLPVVSAVGTAHALGIVHRDLKPENLFLVEGGGVKVLDFGIAKLTAERYLQDGPSALLTESGAMLGTPCYMAPEQASGEHPVDHRADVWSLGVILYECLGGLRPIEGENLPQVVARLMSAGIMPLERLAPGLPAEITTLVGQMLTREVARRTPSLLDVSRALGHFTSRKVPDFPAPSGFGSPSAPIKTLESGRPRTRVDPQGPTMLSSPPVNSSLRLTQSPVTNGRSSYVFGAAVVGLLVLAWLLLNRQPAPSSQPDPARKSGYESPDPKPEPSETPPLPKVTAAPSIDTPPVTGLKSKVRPKPSIATPTKSPPNPFDPRDRN